MFDDMRDILGPGLERLVTDCACDFGAMVDRKVGLHLSVQKRFVNEIVNVTGSVLSNLARSSVITHRFTAPA